MLTLFATSRRSVRGWEVTSVGDMLVPEQTLIAQRGKESYEMSSSIRITVGTVQLIAEMNDSPTAQAVCAALPISASGNRWGEEIYFEIPVDEERAADARADMEVGELGYWPPGKAFCIFFGPTPASSGDRPRAASPVNPIGRVTGDAKVLAEAPDGVEVKLERT